MQVIHGKLRCKKEPYLQISSDLITSQADAEDSERCFLGRQRCNYLVNYHKSIMRQIFLDWRAWAAWMRIWRSKKSSERGLLMKFATMRPTSGSVGNVRARDLLCLSSAMSSGVARWCAKSFALGVDVSRWSFFDSLKLDVTHNTVREHPNKWFDIVGCLVHDALSALRAQDFTGHELGSSLWNAFSLKKTSDPS